MLPSSALQFLSCSLPKFNGTTTNESLKEIRKTDRDREKKKGFFGKVFLQ